MPAVSDDPWISSQEVTHQLSEIEDCAIAVDATYYLQLQLDAPPHEPLLGALGGLTGIQGRLEADLEQWKVHRVIPFFIFDGQSITGQDEVTTLRGRASNEKTNYAWDLYFGGSANDAVEAFGQSHGAYRAQNLYPLLQSLLRQRGLHFLVAPYNAAAQIAYFDMIDSDQVAGIMGSLELMLYPINDSVIRSINWESGTVTAISKKNVLKTLNVAETLFVDAFLMTGTSFLSPFPPLMDPNHTKIQPYSVSDALNTLRTTNKSVTTACTTFSDVIKNQDPNWLDKYQKARMAVNHFIYIAESGEVKVHDYDRLTQDNHEYLGLQLPSELFHYLNTGLIGSRFMTWITHGQLYVLPTLDGVASDEYKHLVTNGSAKIKEAALSLVIPRLNRGIAHKNITMKVWYDAKYSYKVWDSQEPKNGYIDQVGSWGVQESSIKAHFPQFVHGSILSEILALRKPEFVALTLVDPRGKNKEKPKAIDSAGVIQSTCLWRFLHIRGYINDKHELTRWGNAVATALLALEPTVKKYPQIPHLYEQVLVAFELLRLELLHARNKHEELRGLPMNGSPNDQASLLLVSRCATLLKLRHESNGYTGPLNKNLLSFRSLVSEVRSADRDLIEAIVASMFMYAQAKRTRDDSWELSHQLPFLADPDVALGIAVKTYFDDILPSSTPAFKAERRETFPGHYVPYASALLEDIDIACDFFNALYAGVETLDNAEIPTSDRRVWDHAAQYLALRR